MKTTTLMRLALSIGGLSLLAACTTPEARIRRNADYFATLAPDQQQLIREGRVAIGFSPDMVRLALGDPDRVWSRQDTSGQGEAWSYTNYESSTGVPLYRGWYHRYYGIRDPLFPYYLDVPSRKEREVFKVVFRDGKVVEVESNQ